MAALRNINCGAQRDAATIKDVLSPSHISATAVELMIKGQREKSQSARNTAFHKRKH